VIWTVFYSLFVLPERPSRYLFIESLPALALAEVASVLVGVILYRSSCARPSWLFLPILGSSLFIFGLSMLSLAVTLQVSNVRAVSLLLFFLLFALARVPRYVLENGLHVSLATDVLFLTSVAVAVIGPWALSSLNPERVVLSS